DNFFDYFYEIFMNADPYVKERFSKTDFEQQKKLIRHGVNLMIMYANEEFVAKVGLERLRKSHSINELNIHPKYYSYWKASLIQTVAEFDNEFDESLRNDWSQVLDVGIAFISSGYDAY
ncbi:MAG: globin, partial [Bacteroidota bacterium]